LQKSQGFCRIRKTEFLILDKVELIGNTETYRI
jgi:hypothetical protein